MSVRKLQPRWWNLRHRIVTTLRRWAGVNRAAPGSRRRVLFIAMNYAPGRTGGAERQAQLQAEELVRRGHQVTVVCPREPGLDSGGTINGVRIRRFRIPWASTGRRPLQALQLTLFLMRNLRHYDLVHVHLAGLQTEVATPLAHLFGRPLYVKVATGGEHGDVLNYWSLPGLPRRYGLRHADRVQAISKQIAEDLRSVGIAEQAIVQLPNGVDIARFRPGQRDESRAALRERMRLPADRLLVLFVGRFDAQKGLFELLDAWKQLAFENATLLLVGGSEWSPVDFLDLGGKHVELRGFTPEIGDYYRAADVFVLPSHSEGMSNALLEAMTSGLAVISTRVGAAEEMVEHERNGLLVTPGSVDELAEALARLVTDESLRARLAREAAASVDVYDLHHIVDRIEREYEAMLGLSPAAGGSSAKGSEGEAL